MKSQIPQYVIDIIQKLETAGFEGFVVGGCVRDILLDKSRRIGMWRQTLCRVKLCLYFLIRFMRMSLER